MCIIIVIVIDIMFIIPLLFLFLIIIIIILPPPQGKAHRRDAGEETESGRAGHAQEARLTASPGCRRFNALRSATALFVCVALQCLALFNVCLRKTQL